MSVLLQLVLGLVIVLAVIVPVPRASSRRKSKEVAPVSTPLDRFLSEHCTGQDDHDAENCQKCATMKMQPMCTKVLTEDDFRALVAGASVEYGAVRLSLADIGFDRMAIALGDAIQQTAGGLRGFYSVPPSPRRHS